jgi:hypothetical protein
LGTLIDKGSRGQKFVKRRGNNVAEPLLSPGGDVLPWLLCLGQHVACRLALMHSKRSAGKGKKNQEKR